jgi:hypothetical protein
MWLHAPRSAGLCQAISRYVRCARAVMCRVADHAEGMRDVSSPAGQIPVPRWYTGQPLSFATPADADPLHVILRPRVCGLQWLELRHLFRATMLSFRSEAKSVDGGLVSGPMRYTEFTAPFLTRTVALEGCRVGAPTLLVDITLGRNALPSLTEISCLPAESRVQTCRAILAALDCNDEMFARALSRELPQAYKAADRVTAAGIGTKRRRPPALDRGGNVRGANEPRANRNDSVGGSGTQGTRRPIALSPGPSSGSEGRHCHESGENSTIVGPCSIRFIDGARCKNPYLPLNCDATGCCAVGCDNNTGSKLHHVCSIGLRAQLERSRHPSFAYWTDETRRYCSAGCARR